MELSILLAQVLGIYFVVAGLAVFIKQASIHNIIRDFFRNDFLVFFAGAVTFIIGLLVVLNHNVWESSWRVIITIAGWGALLKGVSFFLFSEKAMKKMTKIFDNKGMYRLGSVVIILVGVYLITKGFNI